MYFSNSIKIVSSENFEQKNSYKILNLSLYLHFFRKSSKDYVLKCLSVRTT